MTESQWIELVENRSPDEWAADELAALESALARYPALRESLSQRIEFDQYLYAALSHHQVNAAAILAGAAASRARSARIRGLLICGLAALAIGTWFYATSGPRGFAPPGRPEVADATRVGPGGRRLADDKDRQKGADPADVAVSPAAGESALAAAQAAPANQPAGQSGHLAAQPHPPDAQPGEPAAAPNPPAGEPDPTAAPAEQADQPAAPKDPWPSLATIAAEPPPDDAALAEDLAFNTPAPREADLRRWFAEVPGQFCELSSRTHSLVACGSFSGLARLQSPWAPDAALRMSFNDFSRLRIYLWGEQDGVTLQFLYPPNRAWVAYRATRQPGQPTPDSLVLIGHDEGRNARAGGAASDVFTFDLRCDGKTLSLSRRRTPILRVPFAGLPREVYFEGKAIIRQMQLVRAAELPPPEAPWPVVEDISRPADEKWRTKLGDGAAFNPLADGGVELSQPKNGQTSFIWLPLATDRVQEVILQLGELEAGTGVYMGDAAGKPTGGLGFFRDAVTNRRVVAQGYPGEIRGERHFDPVFVIQGFCDPKPWVKMLVGCGIQRFWISDDGEHWARACEPWTGQRAVIGSVGLYCNPGLQTRNITLRRLIVREAPTLATLAPLELRRQAPVAAGDMTPSEWLSDVCLSQPPGVDARVWRRACALKTLASNAAPTAAGAVLDGLVEDALGDADRPWREQLKLLDETSCLRNCWEDSQLAERCEALYARVGARAAEAGHPEAFAQSLEAQLSAPLWTRQEPSLGIVDAQRRLLLQLVYDREWSQAQTLIRHLRLTQRLAAEQEAMLDWAEAIAPRPAAARVAGKAIMKPEWRHPLSVELSKEAYNVLAELEAALDGKAYRDACQIIATAGAQGGEVDSSGLLPDAQDPDLFLSFPNAVRKAMREHPALAATMNEQFGASGRLRVRQAIADEDAAAVEAATLQFCGSQAAAEAHRWLGDRAVASGGFAQAIAHYDACLKTASAETRARAISGYRLAAAMLDRPSPEGAVGPAEFGEMRLSADEFSRLLDDLRQTRSTRAIGRTPSAAPAAAPPASDFLVQPRARLDGDVGQNPQNVPGEFKQFDIDWVARQCAVAPAGDLLLLDNRFQISAFNAKSGRYEWRTMLGNDQGASHEWPLTPMRPLATTQRVFARQLTKRGPALVSLDLADGKLLWTSRPEPEKAIVSDPVLIQDQLFALVTAKVDQEIVLSLASYDPTSGAAIMTRPLARPRESWWQRQRNCQVAPLDDGLVVACGGSVLRVDVAGRVGWLRRAIWTPAAFDRDAMAQEPAPPLVAGDRLYVAQPGVRQIQCLHPESGRLIWQTGTPALRRVVGLAGERLVIQNDSGFAALAAADGKLLWERTIAPAPQSAAPSVHMLDGCLLADSDTLLAVESVPVGDGRKFTPTLVWIDLATGRPSALAALDALDGERPRFGPLAMADGRLFALSGEGEQDAQREIVELVPNGPAWSVPGDKQADLRLWRGVVDPALSEAVAEVLPRWTLLGGATDSNRPLRLAQWQNESQVLEVQAASGQPFTLARRGQVPPGTPKLALRVAGDVNWKLDVRAGDITIASQTIDCKSSNGRWQDIELSLAAVAGQNVWLIVRQIDIDGSRSPVRWKTLEIRE